MIFLLLPGLQTNLWHIVIMQKFASLSHLWQVNKDMNREFPYTVIIRSFGIHFWNCLMCSPTVGVMSQWPKTKQNYEPKEDTIHPTLFNLLKACELLSRNLYIVRVFKKDDFSVISSMPSWKYQLYLYNRAPTCQRVFPVAKLFTVSGPARAVTWDIRI